MAENRAHTPQDLIQALYDKYLDWIRHDPDAPAEGGFIAFARDYLDKNRTAEVSYSLDRNIVLKLTNGESFAVHPVVDAPPLGDMQNDGGVVPITGKR